jgi:DNA polymerase-3 subunit delta
MNNKKNISLEEVYKLTNLAENFSINELVDTSLSKNTQKTSEIINESNYKSEDVILILRTFLQKAKRLHNLYEKQNKNSSFDSLIDNYKPPIFWKDKPIVKRQLEKWSKSRMEDLIININKTEAFLKRNSSISLMLVFNFIYETSEKS